MSRKDKVHSRPPSSFGAGRSSYQKVVSITGYNYQPHDPNVPGPGHYQQASSSSRAKYSMRPRTSKNRKQNLFLD